PTGSSAGSTRRSSSLSVLVIGRLTRDVVGAPEVDRPENDGPGVEHQPQGIFGATHRSRERAAAPHEVRDGVHPSLPHLADTLHRDRDRLEPGDVERDLALRGPLSLEPEELTERDHGGGPLRPRSPSLKEPSHEAGGEPVGPLPDLEPQQLVIPRRAAPRELPAELLGRTTDVSRRPAHRGDAARGGGHEVLEPPRDLLRRLLRRLLDALLRLEGPQRRPTLGRRGAHPTECRGTSVRGGPVQEQRGDVQEPRTQPPELGPLPTDQLRYRQELFLRDVQEPEPIEPPLQLRITPHRSSRPSP